MLRFFSRSVGECCTSDQLQQLLAGQLSAEETQRVSEHLDACDSCRQKITEMSAGEDWWDELPAMLATDENTESEDEPFPLDAMEHLEFQVERLRQSGLISGEPSQGFVGRIGRYDLHEILGTGGTGIVFRATDTDLHRIVAIKVLAPDLAISTAARRRFAREGQACAAVVHENVVAIHHVSSSGAVPYLVMQYVDGMSLQQIVRKQGTLDPEEAIRIIAQVAAALHAAHERGLIHRDVKPSNILIEASGQHAWISDFGLARAVDDMALTRTGFIAGTPHYMSPGQARGLPLTQRSDLFGLGSVLYFMLTGRPPFEAERTLAVLSRICETQHNTLGRDDRHVPAAVASLVDQLLAKAPEERPDDAGAVAARCHEILANKLDYVSVTQSSTPQRSYWLALSALLIPFVLTMVFSRIVTPLYRRSTERLSSAEIRSPAPTENSRTFSRDKKNDRKSEGLPRFSAAVTDADTVPAVGTRASKPNTLAAGEKPLRNPSFGQVTGLPSLPRNDAPQPGSYAAQPPYAKNTGDGSKAQESFPSLPTPAPEISAWTQETNEWHSQVQAIEQALGELTHPAGSTSAPGVFSMPDDSQDLRAAQDLIRQLQDSSSPIRPNAQPTINRF